MILVVDDEEVIQKTCQAILQEEGFHVDVCSHPQDAINRIKEQKTFDLIISDYSMPDMNGLEMAEDIQLTQKIPVILLSGYKDVATAEQLKNAGIITALTKPIDITSLIQATRSAISHD